MLYRGAALFLMFTDQGDQKHLKIKENHLPAFRDDSGDHGPFFHTECKAFIYEERHGLRTGSERHDDQIG